MKIVVKEPRKPAAVKVIDGSLESMQDIVGGYIETFHIAHNVLCVVNEEGLVLDLPFNFTAPPFFVYGTAFFCGQQGKDMVGLDDGWIDTILNHFGGGL
jgi:hypothetical protein